MLKKIKTGAGWLLLLLAFILLGKKKIEEEEKLVDWHKIKKILEKEFSQKCFLYIVDEKYYIPTLEEVEQFLKEDKTNQDKYRKNFYDCNNYSLVLASFASLRSNFHLAIANSRIHSYDIVIVRENGGLIPKIIEPQTDTIYSIKAVKEEKEYKTNFVYYT